jgi:hypothetical protein
LIVSLLCKFSITAGISDVAGDPAVASVSDVAGGPTIVGVKDSWKIFAYSPLLICHNVHPKYKKKLRNLCLLPEMA